MRRELGDSAPVIQRAAAALHVDRGRRRVLGWLGTGMLSLWGGMLGVTRLVRAQDGSKDAAAAGDSGPQHRWGMAIDLDSCTACGACVVACRAENNVPCSGPDPERLGTGIYWMNLLPAGESELGERPGDTLPIPCMQCDDPPCIKVCPVNATYLTDEGITAQIYDRCIGCRYCEVACPYSVRQFNWGNPTWPETYKNFLNPDVATRPRGVVEKCTFCHHRIQSAKEEARLAGKPLADDTLVHLTACAAACPADAIVFGDLNDENSRVSMMHQSPRSFRLLEHLGTRPKVAYLARDRRKGEV